MARNMFIDRWKSLGWSTAVLRAWLGVTWLYAGLQKSFDPGFLNKASATYIGKQLQGFAVNSPAKFFLLRAIEHAQLIGWVTMVGEIAVGLAILTGVYLQLASLAGAAISLMLWVSVTWNANPYFLGSDSAYFVMWIVLFLAIRAKQAQVAKTAQDGNSTVRRSVLQAVGVGIAAIGLGALGGALQKKPAAAASGKEIVKLSKLPVGGTYQFTAPDGNPAILFRTNVGVFAYSEICTHQGCVVSYTASTQTLDCPCHGGSYDPFGGAKVVAGPPPAPLATYAVAINGDAVYLA